MNSDFQKERRFLKAGYSRRSTSKEGTQMNTRRLLLLATTGIITIGVIVWLIVRGDRPIINPRIKESTYRSVSYETMPTTPKTKTPPPGMKFCKACGKSIPPNSVFCTHCGTRLG